MPFFLFLQTSLWFISLSFCPAELVADFGKKIQAPFSPKSTTSF